MARSKPPAGTDRAHGGARIAPGSALRDYAGAELDVALAHLGWRGGRIHAGVHLARKTLRRTRAAIALGGDMLGPGARLVDRELRRLNRDLSALRDAQALVETLDRLLAAGHAAAIIPLLRRARRAAAARRVACSNEVLRDDPGLGQRRALLAVLRGALLALPWDPLTSKQLRAGLATSESRLVQAQARAHGSARDEDWHRWRRRARRVSQQRRALKAIDLGVDQAIAFDKRTTEQLGIAQDLALLLDHCGRDSPFSKPDRTALRRFAEPELSRQRRRIAAGRGTGRARLHPD